LHDDPEEQQIDKIRAAIRASHRFESFAGERHRCAVKWYIDGHDYFWAVSEIIDSAQQCIYILDWWLTPELYLRRPPSDFPEWRLDRLLKRKAEQGVKVYICVYKEITQTMNMSSNHTKEALQALHPNIKVMRHPDHIGTEHDVQFWSHHEKLLVVDHHRACVGGLDLCFGRWDTHNHPLADAHPTDFSRTLFPGQDYNNGRVLDFQQVDNFVSNQISILETARMPWHDVHMSVAGEVVLDIVQHFIERWNKVKKEKYSDDLLVFSLLSLPAASENVCSLPSTYAWLAFPPRTVKYPNEYIPDEGESSGGLHRVGHRLRNKFQELEHPAEHDGLNALTPFEPPRGITANYHEDNFPPIHGSCNVQVVRSVSDWSHGVLTEKSIQNAYIQLIREASHFIYIENQFFVSNAGDKGPVKNKIAQALTERILEAAHNGQKFKVCLYPQLGRLFDSNASFKVIVVIPEVPGFSGDIQKENAIQTIMAAQWRAINRGGHSIYEQIRAAGFEPTDYIRFYHLRSYDRINGPASFINEMAQNSGVSFFQAQIAQARLFIGDDGQWHQDTIKINTPAVVRSPDDVKDLGTTDKNKTEVVEEVKFPPSSSEAAHTVRQFQGGASRSDDDVSDSVAQHKMEDSTGLRDEQWLGSEQEERDCIVSELLYIHSKLMIVDDRRVIMGSANINDRSQKGDGDSEIALVVEDTHTIPCTMDGRPYSAARFAASLRRKIMRGWNVQLSEMKAFANVTTLEHLGLIPPQFCESGREPVTSFMRAVPYPTEDETQLEEDQQVADPLSEDFLQLWQNTAARNRQIFGEIFRTVPTDLVRNWDQYKAFLPNVKTGHIASDMSLPQVKEKLASIRGALVTAPLDFLIEEKKLTSDENPDWLGLNPTLPIYI
ncbi:hypothetical protein FRB99_001525, partial [Tulasnella sp. 403]